jgi:hypothetical protein
MGRARLLPSRKFRTVRTANLLAAPKLREVGPVRRFFPQSSAAMFAVGRKKDQDAGTVMTLRDLLIYLVVTAAIGAGVGALVGLLSGSVIKATTIGSFAGPIVVAIGIIIVGFFVNRKS